MKQQKVRRGRGAPLSLSGFSRRLPSAVRRFAWLYSGPTQLALELTLPGPAARCPGWVILPRSGSHGPLQSTVLPALHHAGFATLEVDLLTADEARDGAAAFNTPLLSSRLLAVTRWLAIQPEARGKRLAYLAGGAVAGSAFSAAAALGPGSLLTALA